MEVSMYNRYHIETKKTPDIIPHPHRFNVRVGKIGLAKLLIKELIQYRGNKEVILSRPCVYGVFSGPLGGFAPREKLCVGCMRCTTQYPEFVQILHNPQRKELGDAYFTPEAVDTVVYEAESGRVPIKGAGYRGKFGGTGWDSLWTDMSEIVRPTRDGIHGREFISTAIDVGTKPSYLEFDAHHQPIGAVPWTISIPIPLLFDVPPVQLETHATLCHIYRETARCLQSFVILPLKMCVKNSSNIPLVSAHDLEA